MIKAEARMKDLKWGVEAKINCLHAQDEVKCLKGGQEKEKERKSQDTALAKAHSLRGFLSRKAEASSKSSGSAT